MIDGINPENELATYRAATDAAFDRLQTAVSLLTSQRNSAERSHHCVDCCCAQSWKALGITEYTGKSIPEHIETMRRALECMEGSDDLPPWAKDLISRSLRPSSSAKEG